MKLKSTPKATITIVLVVLSFLLFPIKVSCGVIGASCAYIEPATGVELGQKVNRYYEIEPLAITMVELASKRNLQVFYYSGTE